MRLTTEMCTSILISDLQKEVRKLIRRDYPDATPEEVYQHFQEELSKFQINGQHFEYVSLPARLGGHRWYFKCSKCNKRVSKLFLPPINMPLEQKYLCKKCHGLLNQSAVMGGTKTYNNVIRPLKRMKEIEKRLERGYLTSEKTQALLDEYDKIEKKLKSSPEYRLYMFRKKHGMKT